MSATGATIRTIDLDDLAAGVDEETSQAGAIGAIVLDALAAGVDEETSQAGAIRASSLDTKCCRRTERVRPLEQLRVPTGTRPDLETAQHAPERVERGGDVKEIGRA